MSSVVFNTDFEFWQNALGAAMKGESVKVRGGVHGNNFEIELIEVGGNLVTMRSYCTTSPDEITAYYYIRGSGDVLVRTIDPKFVPAFYPTENLTDALIDARNVQSLVDEVGEINRVISNRVISKRLADRAAEVFYL